MAGAWPGKAVENFYFLPPGFLFLTLHMDLTQGPYSHICKGVRIQHDHVGGDGFDFRPV